MECLNDCPTFFALLLGDKHTSPVPLIKLISSVVEIAEVITGSDAVMATWVDSILVIELIGSSILLTDYNLVA